MASSSDSSDIESFTESSDSESEVPSADSIIHTYDWEIKNISTTLNSDEVNHRFSRSFYHIDEGLQFCLRAVFTKATIENVEWFSLRLSKHWMQSKSSPEKAYPIGITRFQLSLQDKNNKLVKQRGNCRTPCFPVRVKNSQMFKKFIKVEELQNTNDICPLILKIRCQIWDIKGVKSNGNVGCKEISDDFKILFQDSLFHDVVISTVTKDFKAHKAVLAARSSVFAAMLQSDMTEAINGVIKIQDFEDTVVEKMLNYIYCGEVNNFGVHTLDLLKIADKYNIQGLRRKCIKSIPSIMGVANALNILIVADQLNLAKLKLKMIKFINARRNLMKKTKSFRNLTKSNPTLLMDLYSAL